jgi:hypothetical protein
MSKEKRRPIEEQLEKVEHALSNAEEYAARNVNMEGTAFLHFDDWHGRSGHPLWMRNFMIPTLVKHRARKEKALETVDSRAKDKELAKRRRQGTR